MSRFLSRRRLTARFNVGSSTVSALLLSIAVDASANVMLPGSQGEIDVSASFSAEYDSNIFANKAAEGDLLFSSGLSVGYARKARYSFDGTVGWNLGRFDRNSLQNFADPSLYARINTAFGENSMGLSLGSARSHRANSILGSRTDAWSDSAAFTWSRPLFKRYSLAGTLGYGGERYRTPGLQNLASYRGGLDIVRALTPKFSVFAGYSGNTDRTSLGGRSFDHSYSLGLSRQILPKVRGGIRVGYQTRTNDTTRLAFGGLTTSIDLTWTANRRLSVNTSVQKGVSTYAAGGSVDTTSASLGLNYKLGKKATMSGSVGGGTTRFLDRSGRSDRYMSASARLGYALGKHLSCSLGGQVSENDSSSVTTADYWRESISCGLSLGW